MGAANVVPTQLFLDMFTQHEIAMWTSEAQKRLEQKINRQERAKAVWIKSRSAVAKAIESASDSLLDNCFSPTEDTELQGLGDPYADAVEDDPLLASEELKQEWTEAAIEQMHEALLMYSLRRLNTRGNAKEKKDVLTWIFDPAAMAVLEPVKAEPSKHVWKFIQPKDVPFSFELCCRFAGTDPQRLRDGLEVVLKNLGMDAIFKDIQNAQQCNQRSRATSVQRALYIQHARGIGKSNTVGWETTRARTTDTSVDTEDQPVLSLR